jgi:hypothetical protein
MRKLSAKWVPNCLNAVQKHNRVLASQDILDRFRQDPVVFLNCLVTMDETWNHTYDSETKKQSKECRQSCSPRPKKFKTWKSLRTMLMSVFWSKDGILLVDYLKNYATIMAKNYVALLNKLKQQLVSKHREAFKRNLPSPRQCFPHKGVITHQKFAHPHLEILRHPA